MSTLISAGAAPPFPNHEDPPQPRRTTIRRPSSARASFVQQKLQTALSHAEKTSVELTKAQCRAILIGHILMIVLYSEDSRAPGDVQVNRSIARYRSTAAVVSFTDPLLLSLTQRVSCLEFISIHSCCERSCTPRTLGGLNVRRYDFIWRAGRAVWIYTDKEGYVQRSTEFSDKQVLDNLQNVLRL
ncbi:hypothetical protein GQ600_771 [Phytophthora cactorum]|nr:hypothetical protein GQ600_771 [Phytophthora cactorum]